MKKYKSIKTLPELEHYEANLYDCNLYETPNKEDADTFCKENKSYYIHIG